MKKRYCIEFIIKRINNINHVYLYFMAKLKVSLQIPFSGEKIKLQ